MTSIWCFPPPTQLCMLPFILDISEHCTFGADSPWKCDIIFGRLPFNCETDTISPQHCSIFWCMTQNIAKAATAAEAAASAAFSSYFFLLLHCFYKKDLLRRCWCCRSCSDIREGCMFNIMKVLVQDYFIWYTHTQPIQTNVFSMLDRYLLPCSVKKWKEAVMAATRAKGRQNYYVQLHNLVPFLLHEKPINSSGQRMYLSLSWLYQW